MADEPAPLSPDVSGPLPPPGARSLDQMRRAHRLESLGRLAGGIAHDFNNVLGVILGYVELAKMNMQGAEPKAVRHLELALNTLGRARSLADHLLDFARLQRPSSGISDLNESVQAVRELLAETLDRQIEFRVVLGSDVPPSPLGFDDMNQALANLCLNAAQAMPNGGAIAVETWGCRIEPGCPDEDLPPGRYGAVRVSDDGPGIPVVLRERIFDPYFTTEPEDRSGLGLWVVRSLVERYGGRVVVEDAGRGAAFTIWLPCELDVVGIRPRAEEDAVDDRGRSVDVLLVHDDAGMRDVVRSFLEMDGYHVVTAGTGAEAERRLQEHAGDVRVVFLDHLLPDAKGADLAWKIHQTADAPRIVMTTGLAGAPETLELPEGTRVLPKPFLHDDMTRLLRDDLGIHPHPRESTM